MKYLVTAILFALLPAELVYGQTVRVGMTSREQASYVSLRRTGSGALYDLDYDKAFQAFSDIDRLFPTHPAGPQMLAARLWLKRLSESRRLQSSLYSSTELDASGSDKIDPRTISEFRALTREARRRCEVRLSGNPKDVEALYWLGAVEGLKASFAEAIERSHFAALRYGKESIDLHQEVLALDPTFIDAKLSVGLYEYVLGSLPTPIKIIAGITGFRGSQRRGLEMLEEVAKEGTWSNGDARALLIILYTREKRFADALSHARVLSTKYPRNYLFKLEAAAALTAIGQAERDNRNLRAAGKAEREVVTIFEQLLGDRKGTGSQVLDLVHFKYGEFLLGAGAHNKAATEFIAATKFGGADADLVTMAHLQAARAFDLMGNRQDALFHYRKVLARPDAYDAHDAAKKGLQAPYQRAKVIPRSGL